MMERRHSRVVACGDVAVGGGNPVRIQAWVAELYAADLDAVAEQARLGRRGGADILRFGVADAARVEAVGRLSRLLGPAFPMVCDIQFNLKHAFGALDQGAAGVRLTLDGSSAGSEGLTTSPQDRALVRKVMEKALSLEACVFLRVRVRAEAPASPFKDAGVALAEAAIGLCGLADEITFNGLILELQSPDWRAKEQGYSSLCDATDRPLMIGTVNPGLGMEGAIVQATLEARRLLELGVGDTLHVSLNGDASAEARTGAEILRATGVQPLYIEDPRNPCPLCGRIRGPAMSSCDHSG